MKGVFEGLKGSQLVKRDIMVLQKALSAYLQDVKVAEHSMALLDKYLAQYWNQAELIASNLPLF